MIKKIKQKLIYKDAWLSFYQDKILLPDGTSGTYAWVKRKNGVGIVVITADNKILLNKEYRYVIKDYSWDIPGGGIDAGETPKQAAKRELHEETGLKVKSLEQMGEFYLLESFNTEMMTLFLTRIGKMKDLTSAKSESSEEMLEQKFVSFKEALEMIDNGQIHDAITANAIQMAIRRVKK